MVERVSQAGDHQWLLTAGCDDELPAGNRAADQIRDGLCSAHRLAMHGAVERDHGLTVPGIKRILDRTPTDDDA